MEFAKEITVGNKKIGPNHPVFVVAEAGVSHFGQYDKALQLVDLAVEAKADAVKFQVYKTENLISKKSPEWYNRMRVKELPYHLFAKLKDYCKRKGIIFFASAHDDESFDFLNSLKPPAHKIGSGEIGNFDYVRKVCSSGVPVFISVGMHTVGEINDLCRVLKEVGNPDIVLLNCTTGYPANFSDVHLSKITALRRFNGVISGYSDHTQGHHACVGAVVLKARVIEKHISLDFDVPDSHDWKCACGYDFVEFVQKIRDIEQAIHSDYRVEPSKSTWAMKSAVASRFIQKGEVLKRDMFVLKRPCMGIPLSEIDKIIGSTAKRKIQKESWITWNDLNCA